VTKAFRSRLTHPSLGQRILAGRVLQLLGEDLGPYLDRLVGDALDAWGSGTGPVQAAAEGLVRSLGPEAARIGLERLGQGKGESMLDDVSHWIVATLGKKTPPGVNRQENRIEFLTRTLAAPGFSDPARQALVAALSSLGARAPRAFLEKTFLEEHDRAVRRIEQGHDDSRTDYRTSLFTALARTAPYPGWARVLEMGLNDPALHVRQMSALHWIRTSGETRPHDRLARELAARRSDHFGRDFLRRAARLGDTATFEFLMALAQGTYSEKARLRVDALNALTSVRWRPFQQKRLIQWLRRRLAREPDPSARMRILMLLANQDPAGSVDVIAQVALDSGENLDVRVQAVNRLGASRQPRAAEPLRALVRRPDRQPDQPGPGETPRIKAAALRAIFALGQREDIPFMLQVLETGPERARRLALSALERLKDPASRTAVEAMTRNGLVQDENRARGLRVLAAIGGPAVADMLLKRLREETQSELRTGALDALALLDPDTFEDRLVHYLRALATGRHQDLTSRDRFAEFLGELGRVPVPVVTGFLIDFLLEEQSGADALPRAGSRSHPLRVSARAALLGHDPDTVRRILAARLDALATTTSGAGLPESFYHALIQLFTHPTHRQAWGDLAVDLCLRLLATPPSGSPLDHHCLRLVAERSFETGNFGRAADAYRQRYWLALLEGYLEREASTSPLVEDPLGRQKALADLAALLAGRADPDSGLDTTAPPDANLEAERNRRILAAVKKAPYDRVTLTTAVQAAAHLGGGFAAALSCLERLGPRRHHPDAALARYELALAFLQSDRRDDALALLQQALADHPPLRDLARREQALDLHLEPDVRKALLAPEEDTP
jgi:tetratricopeptide (TPR) repeat protein